MLSAFGSFDCVTSMLLALKNCLREASRGRRGGFASQPHFILFIIIYILFSPENSFSSVFKDLAPYRYFVRGGAAPTGLNPGGGVWSFPVAQEWFLTALLWILPVKLNIPVYIYLTSCYHTNTSGSLYESSFPTLMLSLILVM